MNEPLSHLPASEIATRLRTFIRQELLQQPEYPLCDNEPLFTGALIDSFSIALLAVFIEQAFGIVLSDSDLTDPTMDTVEGIVARVLRC